MANVKGLLDTFNKKFKSNVGTIGVADDGSTRLSTGIFAFDVATGGGIPLGRISVIFGPESAMKTTICLKLIAQAQRLFPEKRAVFVDVEGHFSADWARKNGVNVEELAYVIPDTGEQMVDVVEGLMYADDVSIIVVDSLAALVTQHELDSEASKAMVGTQGLLINKFYRKTGRALSKARQVGVYPTLVCINQIRYKIGVTHGDPETMPGGPSFKFASSMTIRVYGKDEMDSETHATLPTYKKISMVVKKWKCPILSKNAEFMIALQPVPKYNLEVGGAYDWNTLVAYMKHLNMLGQDDKSNWQVVYGDTGEIETFKTQKEIKERYFSDAKFKDRLKAMVIEALLKSGAGIPASE